MEDQREFSSLEVAAITPSALKDMAKPIPPQVILAVNKLLIKEFCGSFPIILQQCDIIAELTISKTDLFKNHWLDFENHYRQAGWKVVYDKPAYNENYEPTFSFSPKGK